jgi:hypothetical protein
MIQKIIKNIKSRQEWRHQCETIFGMTSERITEIEFGYNLPTAIQRYV